MAPTPARTRRRWLLAVALLAAAPTAAQHPEVVPPALQAATFDKIFAFDRALGDRSRLRVLLVYPTETGPGAAATLQRAFAGARIVAEPVPLSAAAARLGPAVVAYLLPGTATPELLRAAVAARALTIGGGAGLAEQGKASVGLEMRGDKADIVVNLDRMAQEGHDFSAQLLKLARVVHGGTEGAAMPRSGGGTAVPVLVGLSTPAYPEAARRLRVEGDVVLRLSVDESGKVSAVELVRGLGRGGVDEAAIAAARRARFRPASRNGVAVRGTYLLTMPFRL
jgi:TonB family protein